MCTGERMKKRRKELGIKADEVAEALGCSRSTIFRYENGDIEKVPAALINTIANILQTTPAYLMGWADDTASVPSNLLPLPQTRKIPLLGAIACGEPILAEENVEDYIDIDADIHADFALRCKGDSMINARIFNGDIVYIRKQSNVENGEIAAVLIDGIEGEADATLKRFFNEGDKIRLCAANPMYSDLLFHEESMNRIRVIGKAVAFLSAVK